MYICPTKSGPLTCGWLQTSCHGFMIGVALSLSLDITIRTTGCLHTGNSPVLDFSQRCCTGASGDGWSLPTSTIHPTSLLPSPFLLHSPVVPHFRIPLLAAFHSTQHHAHRPHITHSSGTPTAPSSRPGFSVQRHLAFRP